MSGGSTFEPARDWGAPPESQSGAMARLSDPAIAQHEKLIYFSSIILFRLGSFIRVSIRCDARFCDLVFFLVLIMSFSFICILDGKS